MNEEKHISGTKDKKEQTKHSQEQEKLNRLIAKNPQVKTLIEKLDLVLIK